MLKVMSSPDSQDSFAGAKLELEGTTQANTTGEASVGVLKTAKNPQKYTDDLEAERYFSKKEDFDKLKAAVSGVLEEDHGKLKGIWILTQIDHWNNEVEKVLALTEKALYIMKYDFVVRKLKYHRVVLLNTIDCLEIGNIVYPQKSMMKPRNCGAMRLYWGDPASISMAQKWNPMCDTIPYITLMHHPLHYNDRQEADNNTYNVDHFCAEVRVAIGVQRPGNDLKVLNQDILVECYGGLSSVVFNQSQLGFNKDRNGVSF